jgi:recombination protein RecA
MDSGCVILFINQLREKIGVMFGNPETTSGGNALKFYASQRVKIARSGQVKDKDSEEVISNGAKCKVEKNKVAPPFRSAKFFIEFGKGIDSVAEIIDLSEELGILTMKGGGHYSYGEHKLGQGKPKVIQLLYDNPELVEELRSKIIELT